MTSFALTRFQEDEARRAITSSGAPLWERSQRRAAFDRDARRPAPRAGLTTGDVVHGAIGAALGLGVARGAGRALGLGESIQNKVDLIGMGAGTAMNTSFLKSAADASRGLAQFAGRQEELEPKVAACRKHAFRLGFARGAAEAGLLAKRAAIMPMISLDAAKLMDIPKGIGRAAARGGEIAGRGLWASRSPGKGKQRALRDDLERTLIEEEIERLTALRDNDKLRQVLAKRRSRA